MAAVRRILWPELQRAGFIQFSDVAAWRYWDEGIDVVWAESVGKRFAYIEGIPPASFGVGLSIRLTYIRDGFDVPERDGLPIPEPAFCHFRKTLHKTLADRSYRRPDTWRVEKGHEVRSVWDATNVSRRDGLPWFERFRDPHEVLRTLEEDDESYEHAWGFGTKLSTFRQWFRAQAAIRVGDLARARADLEALRTEDSWKKEAETLLQRLAQ